MWSSKYNSTEQNIIAWRALKGEDKVEESDEEKPQFKSNNLNTTEDNIKIWQKVQKQLKRSAEPLFELSHKKRKIQ